MSVVPSRATMEAKLRILYGTGDARTGPTLNRPAYLTATLPSTDMPTQPSTSTHVTSKAAFDLTPARRDESDEDEELHCLCRKPEDGKTMIQCDDCDVWYHLACVKLRHVQVELIGKCQAFAKVKQERRSLESDNP
ncbi:hypothetical protein QFC24_002623 [Naganishia onofrii]|uniref:Uncharacterized protein n=1 Tax=Naganishia onofrii TaxID=1851511 RepID=A0ACC2XQU5_9TREE|nr:hypothetical protein QFC24_002623 [Naganishia onofrii]